MLTFTHVEPHSKLRESYDKMMDYLQANGLKPGASTWETYVNDPSTTPPDKLETMVFVCLAESGTVQGYPPLPSANTRIERVAQAITDIIHAQHRERDGDAGPQNPLGILLQIIGGIKEQATPGRKVRREPKPKE